MAGFRDSLEYQLRKRGIVPVEIKDKKIKLLNWPYREIFDFKIEAQEFTKSSFFSFMINFSSSINLNSVDVKYGNDNFMEKCMFRVNLSRERNVIRLQFSWKELLDLNFHIFDVFTICIICEEAKCEFSFKVAEKYRTKFKKDLSQYDITDETWATMTNLYENNFEIEGKSYDSDDKFIIQQIENYYKMNVPERIMSNQLYEMLRYALQIENLDFCSEYESLVMKDVKIQRNGDDCYSFRYSLELFISGNESFKDFSLEIQPMADYEQNKKNKAVYMIHNYNLDVIIFRAGRSFDLEKLYHIKIIPSTWTFRVCFNALGLLRLFNMEVFFNSFQNPLRSRRIRRDKGWFKTRYFNSNITSNPEQMMAVKNIVEKTAFPFPYVVFGPPGTGKTTVIIESVAQILDRDKNARILITAQSNYAADEIAVRLLKYVSRSKIYRHYSKRFECRKDEIPTELLEVSNMNENFSDNMISVEQFYHFNVIIVTLMSAIRFIELKVKRYFDYIFVDEAGAATEPEVMIPITGFGMTFHEIKSSIVLFGDYKQLGPVVKSEFSEKLGLDVSLMERIVTTKLYKDDSSNLKIQLLDNYRSHPKILEFPNKLFYDNKLRSKISKEDSEFAIGWNSLPNKEIPILLHPVFDSCSQDGHSFYNEDEINIARMYVDFLLEYGINDKKVSETDIGIVTPYRAQLLKLGREFSDVTGIEIGTAEHYQGREKKIMIISTVKSGRDFTVGFLANEKRLNVILTRAKCLLIVICNPINLQRDPQWRDFIEFCVTNKVCFGDKIRLREKFERTKVDTKENSFFTTRKKRIDRSKDVIEMVDPEDYKDVEMVCDTDSTTSTTSIGRKLPNSTHQIATSFTQDPFRDNTTVYNDILSSIKRKCSAMSNGTPVSRKKPAPFETNSQTSWELNKKSVFSRLSMIDDEYDAHSNKLRSEEGFEKDALKNRLKIESQNPTIDIKSLVKEVEKIQHESIERRQAADEKSDLSKNTKSSSISDRLRVNAENPQLKRIDESLERANNKWDHDAFEDDTAQDENEMLKQNKHNDNISSMRNRQLPPNIKNCLEDLNLYKKPGDLAELIGSRLNGLKLRTIRVPLQTVIYNSNKRRTLSESSDADLKKIGRIPLREKTANTTNSSDPYDEWNDVLKTPVAADKITLLDSPIVDLAKPILKPICLYESPPRDSNENSENLINEAKVQELYQELLQDANDIDGNILIFNDSFETYGEFH